MKTPGNVTLSLISLYWYTIRHLRYIQIFNILVFKLYKPTPSLKKAPDLKKLNSLMTPVIPKKQSLIAPKTLCFFNKTRVIRKRNDWQGNKLGKLWLYNLHYFDDLNAADSPARRQWQLDLIRQWITENPPAHGIGWDPYPTSLRIVNWIKWALRENESSDIFNNSLATQVRWLSKRLEYNLLGNHILANAKALVVAGLYFDGNEADSWLKKGFTVLQRQLTEQILDDGGHFERSPMYQAIILEDLLDLINFLKIYSRSIPGDWEGLVQKMLNWLRTLSHPDGDIAFFNDAALNIAATWKELERYSTNLGLTDLEKELEQVTLYDSGYFRLEKANAVIIADCAPIGPDYQPAHAHADTLSFELSLYGKRVFVNSGTSTYEENELRNQQRGTAAHNTVVINNENSSEVWASFRVARRAYPGKLEVSQSKNASSVLCSHNGYIRLNNSNIHKRSWTLNNTSLQIVDEITGGYDDAVAYFYLHPTVSRIGDVASDSCKLVLDTGKEIIFTVDGACDLKMNKSTWYPGFGLSMPSNCLVCNFKGEKLSTFISWCSD